MIMIIIIIIIDEQSGKYMLSSQRGELILLSKYYNSFLYLIYYEITRPISTSWKELFSDKNILPKI
jgi:hypothetical protein